MAVQRKALAGQMDNLNESIRRLKHAKEVREAERAMHCSLQDGNMRKMALDEQLQKEMRLQWRKILDDDNGRDI